MRTRTKPNKQPDAILVGDLHLREDTPICRTDDYMEAQAKKLNCICSLQMKYDCPVLCPGDVFQHWKSSPWLISYAIRNLPEYLITVAGNHDLPKHNIELLEKSAFNTVWCADKLTMLDSNITTTIVKTFRLTGYSYGEIIAHMQDKIAEKNDYPQVAITHTMVWKNKLPFPGCKLGTGNAKRLLKKYPEYDLILTGDNHEAFTEEYQSRLLVNPGSLMRMTASQIDHKPRVYLWYAESNTIEPVYVPVEKNVISRDHIDRIEERDERIDAFVSRLDEDWEVGLDFQKNLEKFFNKNRVQKRIKDLIWEVLE